MSNCIKMYQMQIVAHKSQLKVDYDALQKDFNEASSHPKFNNTDALWTTFKCDGGRLIFENNQVSMKVELATNREMSGYLQDFASLLKDGSCVKAFFRFADEYDGFVKQYTYNHLISNKVFYDTYNKPITH